MGRGVVVVVVMVSVDDVFVGMVDVVIGKDVELRVV